MLFTVIERSRTAIGGRSTGTCAITVAPCQMASATSTAGWVLHRLGGIPPAPKAQTGMQACRVDAQKFCRDVKPGGGAMMDCLIDRQDDISEDCYQLLKGKLQSASDQRHLKFAMTAFDLER